MTAFCGFSLILLTLQLLKGLFIGNCLCCCTDVCSRIDLVVCDVSFNGYFLSNQICSDMTGICFQHSLICINGTC